jgi:chromosome segregation ATPase
VADAIEHTEALLREQTQKAIEAAFALREAKRERDEAQAKYARIFKGLEGSCMSCEPVGALNQQMEQQINRLRKERDEARRQLCVWEADRSRIGESPVDVANRYGWDCFKENA